jgi:nitroimidazol reductase NimA-like FMN-containing flavoprotein (pyridoxamine 5'-phosphate oxidase superfamily)/GNAT superfamily N-acetyltransferase
MRKEIYRLAPAAALDLLAGAPVVHLAASSAGGTPILRTVHGVVVDGALAFHGAPAGEKMEAVGRPAVASAEEVVASIPSYFVDPERACPATTFYRSVQLHGPIEPVDDPAAKARVLAALMAKYQPEGGHVPILGPPPRDGVGRDDTHPLYRKAIAGLLVLRIPLDQLDGKHKLGQNRTPDERARLLGHLWRRGLPGDARAIDLVSDANPDTPTPAFLAAPGGARLVCSLQPSDAPAAADLLAGAYWLGDHPRERVIAAHLGATAWVGARDAAGRLVATARALSDNARTAWIYDVMVAPTWRGRGLGQAVVRLLLDHPSVRNAATVLLGTRDAQPLYARFGFVPRAQLTRPFATTEMALLR